MYHPTTTGRPPRGGQLPVLASLEVVAVDLIYLRPHQLGHDVECHSASNIARYPERARHSSCSIASSAAGVLDLYEELDWKRTGWRLSDQVRKISGHDRALHCDDSIRRRLWEGRCARPVVFAIIATAHAEGRRSTACDASVYESTGSWAASGIGATATPVVGDDFESSCLGDVACARR